MSESVLKHSEYKLPNASEKRITGGKFSSANPPNRLASIQKQAGNVPGPGKYVKMTGWMDSNVEKRTSRKVGETCDNFGYTISKVSFYLLHNLFDYIIFEDFWPVFRRFV